MKALKLTTAGTIEKVNITTLEELQGAVGGYIEFLPLTDTNELVINEEGKIHGLPYNHIASVLTIILDIGLAPGDVIVGDAIIVGAPRAGDREGTRTDVDETLLERLSHLGFLTPTPN